MAYWLRESVPTWLITSLNSSPSGLKNMLSVYACMPQIPTEWRNGDEIVAWPAPLGGAFTPSLPVSLVFSSKNNNNTN